MENKSVVFKGKAIRRTLHNNEWWFSVADIVKYLTGSNEPRQYIKLMRGIAVRDELTDEWQKRSIKEDSEYAILIAEISKAAFNMAPSVYKKHKGLERENLRDHLSDLELIFSMLGDAATTEIARKKDARGFTENKTTVRKGGKITGYAREKLEIETRSKVISSENYLTEPESRKRLKQ